MEWSWLLSPNVIKPIQATDAHTDIHLAHTRTHAHTLGPNPDKRPHSSSPLSVPPPWFRSLVMMCSPCPWPRVYGWVAERCALLWYQWSAILQTASKRTCQWSSYPAEPRTAASHDPQRSWARLTCSEPGGDLWKQLKVFDQFVRHEWAMNVIISEHVSSPWTLWSFLAQGLSIMTLALS